MVGWDDLTSDAIKQGLEQAIFSVCVRTNENEIIAIGRIVGDGAMYFYIQDVIVHQDYRGQGFGRRIMQELMNYLDAQAPPHAFIGLMSAHNKQTFYEKFNFEVRPISRPGMFKIQHKP